MQFCVKCKNICDDKHSFCPSCKRTTGLRPAENNDMVYFIKTTDFESEELDSLFSEYSVKFEIKPYKTGIISSVYDSTYMPTDKVIYVSFDDLETANKLLKEYKKEEIEEEQEPPTKKALLKQSVLIIAFLSLVTLVVLATDSIANFLKSLF